MFCAAVPARDLVHVLPGEFILSPPSDSLKGEMVCVLMSLTYPYRFYQNPFSQCGEYSKKGPADKWLT